MTPDPNANRNKRWQLFVFPLAGLMAGYGVLALFSAVIWLALPPDWQMAVLRFPSEPEAAVGLSPLPQRLIVIIIAVSWIPPISAAMLFMLGYRLALHNNRPTPSDFEPVEITPEIIRQMAEPPTPIEENTR